MDLVRGGWEGQVFCWRREFTRHRGSWTAWGLGSRRFVDGAKYWAMRRFGDGGFGSDGSIYGLCWLSDVHNSPSLLPLLLSSHGSGGSNSDNSGGGGDDDNDSNSVNDNDDDDSGGGGRSGSSGG
ncbi:hypothetical protein E2542_SST08873 [Spatholobus suberectus]|nr:hypothetical protein E2542_SST08873 [Spatholobus suberectus]